MNDEDADAALRAAATRVGNDGSRAFRAGAAAGCPYPRPDAGAAGAVDSGAAGLPRALAIGAAAAALTDVLDGMAARRMHVATPQGGARDSRADHLLSISLAAWLVMLRPDFVREQRLALLLWALLAAAVLAVAMVRRGQLVNPAKAAAVAGYLFALLLLYRGTYSLPCFGLALTLATLAAAEALLVILAGRAEGERGAIPARRHG